MGGSRRESRGLGRGGAAALEFALASPLMIMLLGGSADFGLAMYTRATLANAVAAGAEFAYLTGPGVTLSQIQTVVTNVSGLSNLSFTNSAAPAAYCLKGSPPTKTSATAAGDACPSPQLGDTTNAVVCVVINATYTSNGIMGSFMPSSSYQINETATVMLK